MFGSNWATGSRQEDFYVMVLFQICVRQSCSPTKMATTVQLRCYWKCLWSRWAITGSWEPLVPSNVLNFNTFILLYISKTIRDRGKVYLERQKSYGTDKLCWEEAEEAEEKIRLKQYVFLRSTVVGHFQLWELFCTLSHQDGHHSAVALLLKVSLIQVSDYRLLGTSGSIKCSKF
jgi:hypothetical protein